FEKLVEELQPERSLGRSPLFQVKLVLQNLPTITATQAMTELKMSDVEGQSRAAKYDLTLSVSESRAGLNATMEYNTDLFEAETVARMCRHLQQLLTVVAAEPQQAITRISLLSEQESRQILEDWNATDVAYGPAASVHELFEQQVERTPDATALMFEGQSLSYRELNERANQLAHYLRACGVGAEVLVGLCLPRSIELAVGLLGILKAGGAYVPLDAEYPKERLSFMMEDAALGLLLTNTALLEELPVHWGQTVCLDDEWEAISSQTMENVESAISGENLAYVIYTSGSTGQPKGVMVSHGALADRITSLAEVLELQQSDRFLQFVSPSFDAFAEEFYTTLSCGAALVMQRNPAETSAHDFLRVCETQSVSVLHFPAAYWHQLTNELSQFQQRLPERIRMCLTGGESPSIDRLVKWFELSAAGIKFINAYGPTEAIITATFYKTSAAEANIDGMTSLPIGRPLSNTQIYILDSEFQLVPAGIPGDMYIGGRNLARGYLNHPELAADRFVPNPFSNREGSRLYKTGDVACYMADGNIRFQGRSDNQVKLRGYRIELGEIEGVLNRHPNVAEAAVVLAHQDEEREKRLVAYIVADVEEPTSAELRAYLAERVPEYMIPSVFMTLEAFPLTPNGKIDHAALPTPEYDTTNSRSYTPARTANEVTLARIWGELLNLERVGIHDNFFELGGDSILSIQVVGRANQAGIQITPRQLFQHQTIAELAAVSGTAPVVEAEQGVVSGVVPLTPIQRWFLNQKQEQPHHYNQALLFELKEELDSRLLEEALGVLQRHHDALRMRFIANKSGWEQLCSSDFSVPFTVLDYSALTAEQQRELIEQTAATVQASLDLTVGPIWRAVQFQLGGGAGRLLLVVHHLVVDGVSWRILLQDLQESYEQLATGVEASEVRLAAKSSSFKQWAERVAAMAHSAEVAAEKSYWQSEARRSV
ncbi:MAG TPA: amino acid adenylation domain-containing protein, partial [Pyrinomonadaceae bacterium]|nr:amino acid adenylation domain-containing protein [Pyrinomonadaceae bacterium]